MTTARRGLDWAGKHGTASGTAAVCGWALAVAVVAHALAMSRWWGPVMALAGALATQIVSVHRNLARATQVYRACCWVGLGAWGWWAIGVGPWHPEVFGGLAVLTLVGGVLATVYAHLEARDQERRIAFTEQQRQDQLGERWEKLINKVSSKKCVVERLDHWPDGNGFTLDVALPDDGSTWESFKRHAAGLAAAARLPNGCGVELDMGCDRGHMLVKVTTVEVLSQHRHVPADYSPISINDPVFLGWERDGGVCEADLRQTRWLHGAAPNTGKTTQQRKVASQVARMVDALGWVMDFNAAALGVEFAREWREGRASRPAVDWIAGDEPEAWLQTEAMLAVMEDRKITAAHAKREANTTLMPIDCDRPAIVLIGDEMRDALAVNPRYPRVQKNITALFDKGRDAGMCFALSVLRGTIEYISTSLLKFCDVVLVMNPGSEGEVSDFLGWHTGMKPEDAPYPGCAIGRPGKNERVRAIKCPDMLPEQVAECSRAITAWHVELDEAGQAAIARRFEKRDSKGVVIDDGRWVYEKRWERAEKWFGTAPAPAMQSAGPAHAEQGAPEPKAWPKVEGTVDDAFAATEQAVDRLRERAEGARRGPELPADPDAAFREITAGMFLAPVDPPVKPKPRDRVWQLLTEAGEAGTTPTELERRMHEEGYKTTRPTIHDWLTEWVEQGRVRQPRERGPYHITGED